MFSILGTGIALYYFVRHPGKLLRSPISWSGVLATLIIKLTAILNGLRCYRQSHNRQQSAA